MSQDQFDQLWGYLEGKFAEIDQRFEEVATKDDLNQVYNILDAQRDVLDTHTLELAAIGSKLDRMEKSFGNRLKNLETDSVVCKENWKKLKPA